jgi:hypothetical protein
MDLRPFTWSFRKKRDRNKGEGERKGSRGKR